ncbi:uncharacterized protein TrAFT101_000037 [Trichoderma asperellum]|uniref:Sulfatase N-terminal domain-containing protein n=1 Tax=Trichoderma asperellum (strain ATCC 204424 / CBS 433.97 / NBRC 101777) TaxID=1042311 RepID=A0A2T3YR07_TRIA4|nr:hypothetical protein M441DRAFT_63069 [Trichoderma asperellum CBS 433.97]PTB35010.1 hypothetical protein M441DRAFT_63069 [Trichoderma asperellum CBS 433.97]UKZ84114.1 hypothetical protein TrAFT101_000037 [Trichoderma asperellum]
MAKEHHRNIVQLVADDLGLMLGCYGLQAIKTPNIDRLASQGTRFTHAFASTASCSGSRSTIYTGLHTHQNGQYGLNHGWNHFQTHEHIETLPRIFNALGYQTGIIGKVHVGPHEVYPWEWFAPSHSRDVLAMAEQAGQFFDKASETGRQFHLTVGFRDPHRDATRMGFGNEDSEVAAITVPDYQPEAVEIPEFISDVPELRRELVEYYKSISRMDVGVGKILEELEARGLSDNTLVILVSDNGAPFVNSKTTLYDAGVKLPLIVRQPGAKAGVVNPNLVSFLDILPTCIDWAGNPSFQTAQSDTSPPRLGTSFLRILDVDEILPKDKWKQYIFGSHTFHEIQNYWPTRFMRDRKYKYHRNIAWRLDFPFGTDLYGSLSWEGIRNSVVQPEAVAEGDTPEVMIGRRRLAHYLFRGPEELFDLEADPEEVNNLAKDPVHQAILEDMRKKTEEWQYMTSDVWLFRDGVSAITSQKHQKLGLELPDRFDFDLKKPGNVTGPYWAPPAGVAAKEQGPSVNMQQG